ncbi:hypothetical protein HNQ91_001170 [Filimonas zeae]|nr:hypothetical protein [Filimonas zeae]MDR6338148.1 hypothetical protein [Filimonas zeae]
MPEQDPDEIEPIDIDWLSFLKDKYANLAKVYFSASNISEINTKLTKRLRKHALTKQNYNTNIYDFLVRIKEFPDSLERIVRVGKGLISFLDGQVNEFITLTNNNPELLRQLKEEMADMFWENEAKYLDRVGELVSTVFLIKEMAPARLHSFSHVYLPDGTYKGDPPDADLCFEQPGRKPVLIEIRNINLNYERITSEEGLYNIIAGRITKKWAEKKFDSPGLNERYDKIWIQPFIWIYDQPTIERYTEALNSFTFANTLPLLSLQQAADSWGNIYYRCHRFTK